MNKLYSMLGIGNRARLIVLGETGCIQSIKRRNSKLIILSQDASDNTKKRIINLCEKNNIRYYIIGKKAEYGDALGKGLSSIISVTDFKFSEAIVKIIKEIQ